MTLASDARAIFRAGVGAADPGRSVQAHLRLSDRGLWASGRRLTKSRLEPVHVIAIGKAAASMADAAAETLGNSRAGGVVVQRSADPKPENDWTVLHGTHPLPSSASDRAARRVLHYVGTVPTDAAILFLISGGGSAIFETPSEHLSVPDLRRSYAALLASGAPIQAMNTVRRHLSGVKGGRLAVAASPRPIATLAISDVVGDTPHDIASGPTVADPTTFEEAARVVRTWSLATRLTRPVVEHLKAGAEGKSEETPKVGDPRLAGSSFHLVATNRGSLWAAGREARQRGYRASILTSTLTGETQKAARELTKRFGHRVGPDGGRRRPLAWLAGGETTVKLGRRPGRGGRNQEFVVASATVCDGWRAIAILSAGTDGVDGPTDAAGGWVVGETGARARALGIDLSRVLRRHDAYPALRRLGGLFITGATGTNVMDLHVLLAGREIRPRSGRRSARPR